MTFNKCTHCHGKGYVTVTPQLVTKLVRGGYLVPRRTTVEDCIACDGNGYIISEDTNTKETQHHGNASSN
jgi:Ribonuclease G/E